MKKYILPLLVLVVLGLIFVKVGFAGDDEAIHFLVIKNSTSRAIMVGRSEESDMNMGSNADYIFYTIKPGSSKTWTLQDKTGGGDTHFEILAADKKEIDIPADINNLSKIGYIKWRGVAKSVVNPENGYSGGISLFAKTLRLAGGGDHQIIEQKRDTYFDHETLEADLIDN